MEGNRIRATLSVIKNSLRMSPDHFRSDLSRDEQIQLFKDYVELIEVETTAYCNRTCSFCPNSFLDRRTVRFMPDDCWETILDGLREVDYDGTFVWSRYSEPVSEKTLANRVTEVKAAAPKCRVAVNTNGDYLNVEIVKKLSEAGVDRLWIDTYVDDMIEYTYEIANDANEKLLGRIKLLGKLTEREPEYAYKIMHPTMEITNHVRNITTLMAFDLSDRGGLIQMARKTARQSPCYAVYKHLVIDWDGSVMPCCQLRSDSPSHKSTVLGQIGPGGLDLVTAYARLSSWRKHLAAYGPKKGVCASCNVYEYESNLVSITAAKVLTDQTSVAGKMARKLAAPMLKKKQRY
ncbi:MAG TPA: radical SAM protein [Blastocatellia bacterium]|nr:radical SAM protein [Blastocatellia bacterium]